MEKNPMSNEELVIRIKAGIDVAENMLQLYQQVKSYIHTIAWGYRGIGELEDLEQEGYLALYPAIDGYDRKRGVKFLTYAEQWIRQSIRRYIQNNGSCLRLPVHRLESIRRYERFMSSYAKDYGKEPSVKEIAINLGWTMERVIEIQEDSYRVRLGSLDSLVTGLDSEGDKLTVGDMVSSGEDIESDILEKVQQEGLKAELWACVDSLPGRQPAVLRMRYQEHMTLGAIGQKYDTTMEAVRQIHTKALRELRRPKYSKRLRPFLAEQVYSIALYGSGVESFQRTWTSSTERAVLWLEEREDRRREHQELLEKIQGKSIMV